MTSDERERVRQIQLRVAEEHAATIEREDREGTRERIEEKIAKEFEAHLAREDALIDSKDPTGAERRAQERGKIARFLASAFWIALLVFGPEACTRILNEAGEHAEAERAREKERANRGAQSAPEKVE